MKRVAFALVSLVTLCLSTGCCGWGSPCGYRGGYYGGGGCATGNCGIPQGIPPGGQIIGPQSSNYHSPESFQDVQYSVPQSPRGPITGLPVGQPITTLSPNEYPFAPVPRVAARPLESLPTY